MNKHEIDEHLEAHEDILQADPASDGFDLCRAYHAVRPILVFITESGILKIFKPKWVDAIKKFIAAQDIKCPL